MTERARTLRTFLKHQTGAVVATVIDFLVMIAAVQYDPDKAKGLDGALNTLAGQPYGKWLLVFIALDVFRFHLMARPGAVASSLGLGLFAAGAPFVPSGVFEKGRTAVLPMRTRPRGLLNSKIGKIGML